MKSTAKIIAASLIAVGLTGTSLAIAAQKNASDAPLHSDLSIAQVSEIALAAQPGTIEEISLENEDGKAVFEVEIKTEADEVEVLIDAASGEVLSVEKDKDHAWFGGKGKEADGQNKG
ncbi:PepSY domain-containing protein [uncultured Roseibium sp.]|uniref:PepSY domain-containing protein n=1 Tax=uncultured Roseibium sp. TaxID=1936171 RepID=UPI002636AAA5|nr:PepSY domain-containing protein [uncultured Roseibium sp.]